MNRLVLSVFLILGTIQVAHGIKCYVCSDTVTGDTCSKSNLESNKDTYLKECPAIADMCMRAWAEKPDGEIAIGNDCGNQDICDKAKKLCEIAEEQSDGGKCRVGCCDTDACNAATPLSFSLFLITVCSVLGLIFLK